MVHTTSAKVRLAKIDRQIAELRIERAKITGEDWEPIWFKAEGERIAALKDAGASEGANAVEQPKQKRVRVDPGHTAADLLSHLGYNPLSSEELQKLTGLDKNRLRRGLQKLIDEGRVVTTGAKRGMRYLLRAC